jgi:hypothetical protein
LMRSAIFVSSRIGTFLVRTISLLSDEAACGHTPDARNITPWI